MPLKLLRFDMPLETPLPPEALKHLAESGLTAADAEVLHIGYRTAEQTAAETLGWKKDGSGYFRPSLEFVYPSHNGPRHSAVSGFFDPIVHADGKQQRYAQAAGTSNRLYLPPSVLDWPAVQSDTSIEIVFTEGEKKTAAGCKSGFIVVGLAGAWSWRVAAAVCLPPSKTSTTSIGTAAEPPSALTATPRTTPRCRGPQQALAAELRRRGAIVRVVRLPAKPGDLKMGLDDYLLAMVASHLENCSEAKETRKPNSSRNPNR